MKSQGKVVRMAPRGRAAPVAEGMDAEALRDRVEELEDALRARGPLFGLARLLRAGRHGLSWENVARLWAAVYFSWHSEETDEFGYDRKFTEAVMPFFEFLYAVWWLGWVALNFAYNIDFRIYLRAETLDELQFSSLFTAVTDGASVPVGLLAIAVVHRTTQRQEARALRLREGMLTPPE